MNFVDKKHSGNELSDAVINVFVDDLIDFKSKFLCDLSFLWPVNLAHQGKEITAALWSSVCDVKIVKCYILNNFFFLMNITFRNWDILFSFQIEFSCV